MTGATLLTRVLSGALFQVSALDPLTYIWVALLLAVLAIAAAVLPARRAAGLDPVVVLKE